MSKRKIGFWKMMRLASYLGGLTDAIQGRSNALRAELEAAEAALREDRPYIAHVAPEVLPVFVRGLRAVVNIARKIEGIL